MKLNNNQINALASDFYKKLDDKYTEANQKARKIELEKFRSDYNKGIKFLKANTFINNLSIKISDNYTALLQINMSFEEYTKSHTFNYVIETKKVSIGLESIKRDIILSTIDAKSLDDIIEKLEEKYK
jgi:hypothetical protein